jgi:hypothetical protein
MKKVNLFLFLAMIVSTTVIAQSEPQLRTPMAVKTRVGLRAGLNLADMRASDQTTSGTSTMATGSQSKTSFNAGIFVNVPIGTMLRFQPEVSLSSQGGKITGGTGSGAYTFEQDLHYVNVPLMLQVVPTQRFFLETGPQVGYLVSAETKNPTGSAAPVNGTDNKAQFDKIDFGWNAGVGYMSRIGLGLNARYTYGIANIMEDNNNSAYYKNTWKNSVAQVSLVYHFGAFK